MEPGDGGDKEIFGIGIKVTLDEFVYIWICLAMLPEERVETWNLVVESLGENPLPSY